MVRARHAAVAVALAVTAVAASAPAASAAKRPCSEAGSKTIVASSKARVYRTTRGARRGWVHGCLYSRNKRVGLLTHDMADERLLLKPVLAGRFVAAAVYWQGAEVDGQQLRVVDLRSGRLRYIDLSPYDNPEDPNPSWTALVLNARGTAAWAWTTKYEGTPPAGTPPPGKEIRRKRFDQFQPPLGDLLDSGPDLDLASLRREGETVTWLKAGAPQSAPLP